MFFEDGKGPKTWDKSQAAIQAVRLSTKLFPGFFKHGVEISRVPFELIENKKSVPEYGRLWFTNRAGAFRNRLSETRLQSACDL